MDQVARSSQMADELNSLNRFGWRMAVPRSLVYSFAASQNMREDDLSLDFKLMPNEMSTNDRIGKLCSMPSVVLSFQDGLIDDEESGPGHVIVRQNSLIAPKISTTIADIYFDRVEWRFYGISLLGFGHLAAVFRCNTDLRSLRFMVFEVSSSRLARTFDIELSSAPWDDGVMDRVVLLSAYLNDDSTLVVYWNNIRDVGFRHFLDKFEIPKYEVGAKIPVIQPIPMARDSHLIPWPHPVYYAYYQKLGRQSYIVLFTSDEAVQPLFSYNDDHGRWFYHTLERLQELWVDTPFGHWDVGLLKSLDNLHQFLFENFFEYPIANRHFVYLSNLMFGFNDGVSVYRSYHGLMRRWHHNVPFLKISAAESLFRAIPDLDRWELKKAVGFDIFDGMSTVNDEAVQKYSVDGTAMAAENEEAQDEEATIEDKKVQGTNEENEAEETSQNDEVHAMKENEGTSKKSCCGCVIM